MTTIQLKFRELEERLEAIAALIGTDCLWKRSRHSLLEPAMSRRTTRHERPFCMAVKRKHEQICIHQDMVKLGKLLEKYRKGFTMRCHAGAEEFIIPIYREERLLGTVACGPFRLQKNGCIYSDAEAEYNRLPHWQPEFAAALEKLAEATVAPLVRALYRLRPELLPVPVEDSRIQKVLEYMQNHYAERITLDTAAKQVFLSTSRLSHLFRESCKEDFSTYLLKLRVFAARELLSGTGLAINEIAVQCGFSSQHHFAAMFRKQTQMTASTYRKLKKRIRI